MSSSDEDDDLDHCHSSRSNYFQTEFTVSVKKGRENDRNSNSGSPYDDERKNVCISIQTANRSMVGAEENPKERKRWVRPPLVGQASSGSDSQLSMVPAHEGDDSDCEIVESSQEPYVSIVDYPNRRDYISEKPPEGSPVVTLENRPPSPSSASSLTSGRPLEWDSGADVGYFQSYPGANTADKLCSLERMALDGSASLLTRSDPEGTVEITVPPPPPPPLVVPSVSVANSDHHSLSLSRTLSSSCVITPNAESTPNFQASKSSRQSTKERPTTSHLFPEVIIHQNPQNSDSDGERGKTSGSPSKTNETPKRSTSLEDVVAPNQPPTPFTRSQSQNNLNFDMSAHLLKIVQPQSNSSSSVATVVKGCHLTQTSDKKESESGSEADGRANSFEYVPGSAFEHIDNQTNDPLKTDIERGVKLLSEFVKGTNANNTLLKKKLLKTVVEELLAKKYPGEDWSSTGSSQGQTSGHWLETNASHHPPSTGQVLPSVPEGAEKTGRSWAANSWPLEIGNERCVTRRGHSKEQERSEISGESAGSQASLLARMDNAGKPLGTSASTVNSSSVTESSIKQQKQILPNFKQRAIETRLVGKEKSGPSSSTTQSDWKIPATKTEKVYEMLKQREGVNVVDPDILRYLHCERENQLDWIKKEIDHLSNLKRLLEMHQSLRKNYENLKKTKERKQRSMSAEAKTRPKSSRKLAHGTRSEPLKTNKPKEEKVLDNGWDSHDYGVSSKGVLKKNASTNTFASDSETQTEILKKPISYTILFDAKGKENTRVPFHQRPIVSNVSVAAASRVTIANREVLKKESRERVHEQYQLNLQEELMKKKPDYVARAEMRRQTVAELTAMREIREKNRGKLLSAAANGEQLPTLPNPLAVKRITSQKSMRQQTEKTYKKSSLVKQKQMERKKKETMITNRLMADMFNRNLQRRILKGETYLSNSINVLG